MGLRKLLTIKESELKTAKKVLQSLELLGITEDDLVKIKIIPELLEEIRELKEFKDSVLRSARNETAASQSGYAPFEQIKKDFETPVEEFKPYGK